MLVEVYMLPIMVSMVAVMVSTVMSLSELVSTIFRVGFLVDTYYCLPRIQPLKSIFDILYAS